MGGAGRARRRKASAATEGRIHFAPTSSRSRCVFICSRRTRWAEATTHGGAALTVTLREPSDGVKLGERRRATVNVVSARRLAYSASDEDQRACARSTVPVARVDGAPGGRHARSHRLHRVHKGRHRGRPCRLRPNRGPARSALPTARRRRRSTSVTVHNDTHFEGDETLQVLLTDATGGATFSLQLRRRARACSRDGRRSSATMPRRQCVRRPPRVHRHQRRPVASSG